MRSTFQVVVAIEKAGLRYEEVTPKALPYEKGKKESS
jgi:hypothetical protein